MNTEYFTILEKVAFCGVFAGLLFFLLSMGASNFKLKRVELVSITLCVVSAIVSVIATIIYVIFN